MHDFYQIAPNLHFQRHFLLPHSCQLFIVLTCNYACCSNSMVFFFFFLLLYALVYIIILTRILFSLFFSDKKFICSSKSSLIITFLKPFSNLQGLVNLILLFSWVPLYIILLWKLWHFFKSLYLSQYFFTKKYNLYSLRTGTVSCIDSWDSNVSCGAWDPLVMSVDWMNKLINKCVNLRTFLEQIKSNTKSSHLRNQWGSLKTSIWIWTNLYL